MIEPHIFADANSGTTVFHVHDSFVMGGTVMKHIRQ